jgi:DNA repair protein RadD
MILRPYQINIITEFYRTTPTFKRVILVAPTGSGKTVIGAEIIKDHVAEHQETVVLAHRCEIVKQTADKLRALGILPGIIMVGVPEMPMAPVQVASIASLSARAMRPGPNGSTRMELPPAKLLVIDECQHATAPTWRAILDSYTKMGATVLGLTATPCRGDGRGLGGIFDTMLQCPQVTELIKLGYLVPSRVYAPAAPDLDGIKTVQGDYHQGQLEDRMDKDKLVADIVTQWIKHGEGRPTVCFATGVGHSIHIRDRFREAGIRADHIDGGTPKNEREATLAALAAGKIDVVSNCLVLTEGWDLPVTACCVLARPTRQMGLYRQMIGRVLRPANGKTDAVILDHSGAVFRHGLPEDPVCWTLDPNKMATNKVHDARKGDHLGGAKILECSQCGAIREGGKACPCCGFLPVRKPDLVVFEDGELALVQGRKRGVAAVDKRAFHRQLAGIAQERGYKPGWADYKFKEKFGHWPPRGRVDPIDPTPEIRSWVRSRQIAWARSRERRA